MPVSDVALALELHSVSIGYDDHPVVVDVDLTVQRSDVVAVLGANGSGKTTLVRGLLGLARVLHGRVIVLGSSAGSRGDRARIGYVPQRHTVGGPVPATVREVVASGRLARRGLLRPLRRVDSQVIDDAIGAVDLSHHAKSNLNTLSGGQQRRVLIARALAAQPDVMVMDEPTAGVDRASQEALARTVARLRDRGVTVLVVTHEVGPLTDVVNRAVVMHDGRVTYDGPLTRGLAAGHADSHHVHDPADPTRGQHGLLGSLLGGGG